MKYYSSAEIQKKYNLSYRRIQQLCKSGVIKGAYTEGNRWRIPESEIYLFKNKEKDENEIKPLSNGISDFEDIKNNYYFSDKSSFIKTLIKDNKKLSVFLYPHGFSKTTIMSMTRSFFELGYDSKNLFDGLSIMSDDNEYLNYMNKYPVIYISLKNVKYTYWSSCFRDISDQVVSEISRHKEIEASDALTSYERAYYNRIVEGKYDEVDIEKSLKVFSDILKRIHNSNVIIIFDGYDIPSLGGYEYGYYSEAKEFMQNMISYAFKDNDSLYFGIVSGMIYDSSILSTVNFASIHKFKTSKYDKYFVFDSSDVKSILNNSYKGIKSDEIKGWAGGYYIKDNIVFSPLSVSNYKRNCYENISSYDYLNQFIIDCLNRADVDVLYLIRDLIKGHEIEYTCKKNVSISDYDKNYNILSFFIYAGLCSVISKEENRNDITYIIKVANTDALISLTSASDEKLSTIEKAIEVIEERMEPRVKQRRKPRAKKEKVIEIEPIEETTEDDEEEEEVNYRRNDIQDYLL